MSDRSLQRWVVEHRVPGLDQLFEALTYAGSYGLVWLGIAVLLSGRALPRVLPIVRVGVAILAAELFSGLLKLWIDRDRPPVANPDPEPLVGLPVTNSMPSGHATVAFACATVLTLAAPRLALPLYALAALIAFSRVYVGVHYPLDTLAGAALGTALGLAVVAAPGAVRALRRPRAARPRSRRTPPAG